MDTSNNWHFWLAYRRKGCSCVMHGTIILVPDAAPEI